MTRRVTRIVIGALVGLVFVWSLALGGTQPHVVYSADPTPTPAQTNSGDPGGSSGGGH